MQKLIELSKFMNKLGLKKEASFIRKLAMPLPAGENVPAHMMGGVLETPTGITEPFLKSNLDLKQIFQKYYDPGFFKSFNYIHYFRGSESSAADFVRSYGINSGGNPVELSVVGAPVEICSLKQKTESHIGGSGSFAFLMEGEPTSAFFYDVTSSYYGQMSSPAWLETLTGAGIDPEQYNPKLINISSGRLNSFFFDKASYDEAAAMGHPSNYHEIFLKNSKVRAVLLDEKMDKKEVYDFLSDIDPYWVGEGSLKKIDIIFCSGSAILSDAIAKHRILDWLNSYYISSGNKIKLDGEKFENMFMAPDAYTPSEQRMDPGAKIFNGLEVLRDGLYNEANLEEIFSYLNYLVPQDGMRDFRINNFMKDYIESYEGVNYLYNLEELWVDIFTSKYRKKIKQNFAPREVTKNVAPVNEFTIPIFNKIKQDINSCLTNPSRIKASVATLVELLTFLSDLGMDCYEKNIDNNAFNYYLTMVQETEELVKNITENNSARDNLTKNYDGDIITSIYEIQKYNPNIVKMIIDAYRAYPEYEGEVNDAITKAEENRIINKY